MTFSSLESLLLAMAAALVTGIGVRLMLAHDYVRKCDCAEKHRRLGELDIKFSILFQMVRALVVYSDMPEEKKTEILNFKA